MKDWLKGLFLVTIGNVLYQVIPNWTVEFLLKQPNPLYSIGTFFRDIPKLENLLNGNPSVINPIITIVCVGLVGYGIYLFIGDIYRKS